MYRHFFVVGALLAPFIPSVCAVPLPTGASITPAGTHTAVDSFPVNMVLSRDGKFVVVTHVGARQSLTVLDSTTGEIVSQRDFNGKDSAGVQRALFYGLAFGPNGALYASRGTEDTVSVFDLSDNGILTDAGQTLANAPAPKAPELCAAGIAADAANVYAANNNTTRATSLKGSLSVFDAATGERKGLVVTPGFPFGVAAVTDGPAANRKVFVSSERDGVVCDIDPQGMKVRRNIRTQANPTALLLDGAQKRLFVANSGSDTVSIIDTATDKVVSTILLRPAAAHGLPGCTPEGMAIDPAGKRLYVALADMNAIAILDVSVALPKVLGYIPVGWYPTSVVLAPDGRNLFVANARGNAVRIPNDTRQGPGGKLGQYILAIQNGTVSRVAIPNPAALKTATAQVLKNNRITSAVPVKSPLAGVPIKHVIYIIKENRTYDQILGDVARGNGDPGVVMWGREVTPNQHAFVDRFVLLDNFYCCAEVSGTGWNWSTSGMANEYTQRTVESNYAGRGRTYDWEGSNGGVAVDLMGINDVAAAPGGYIWDAAIKHGVSLRNYGFFVGDNPKTPQGGVGDEPGNRALKKALEGRTCTDFRQFALGYADSDAWVKINAPKTVSSKRYGKNKAPSRFSAWKREFDGYVSSGKLPAFEMVRLGRDHTEGTQAGAASPSAMVADNDYAVGQLVEAVSNSPFWKSTAIFVIEDDAQGGHDHVDCHRSTAYVVSPFVKKGTLDSRFYNTDSVLRSMEAILGLPPMCRYDATAPIFDFWTKTPDNAAPYKAILPPESVLRQVNARTAYRAKDSAGMSWNVADSIPDQVLNDILWHAVKGPKTPAPAIRGL
ncbi:MAG TPA: alkaline phosphatase family protein [Armatimonadota bacterium]|jgi:YVTN family beta-propeller protein